MDVKDDGDAIIKQQSANENYNWDSCRSVKADTKAISETRSIPSKSKNALPFNGKSKTSFDCTSASTLWLVVAYFDWISQAAVDGRKKARCTCDGSPRSGQVRILNETYTNCVDQTSARLFYGIAAAENLIVYGADVSNAFAEAPPPKQGFYIRPDRAFNEWWTIHKKRPPIPPGHMIPILSAMQGHPESPRLWEKHADAILRELGLTPTIHEPCLYSGVINGKRIIFMRQVDDFAIAAPDAHTADLLLDMLDDKLSIPIKRQGHLDMYNGVDILQTHHYIRLSCTSFIDKISEKYLSTWMKHMYALSTRPTPFPTDSNWWSDFNKAIGDPDEKGQALLACHRPWYWRERYPD